MTREEAYQILTKHIKNKNLLKHCLATEAAMIGIYRFVIPEEEQTEKDQEKWGITGLLHDGDYEVAQNEGKLDQHGSLLFDELEKGTIPEEIETAIRSHNFTMTGTDPVTAMDWAITCCDQLTGLIVACALVHPARNASASVAGGPDKKLESLTVEFVHKKFTQKAFARGADRKMIGFCEDKLQIPLPKFIEIVLNSMKSIHKDLGL